jgi:hypothetical protein
MFHRKVAYYKQMEMYILERLAHTGQTYYDMWPSVHVLSNEALLISNQGHICHEAFQTMGLSTRNY